MKRALLLSGGVDAKHAHRRYRNNLALWRRVLVESGGFGLNDVMVLLEGGGPLAAGSSPGATAMAAPCVAAEINDALAWLSEADELALLVASNHGISEGICLWGDDILTPDALEGALGTSDATHIWILGQCQAASFARTVLPRTVVCWAASDDGVSHGSVDAPEYDSFLLELAAAMLGAYPDGGRLKSVVSATPQDAPTLADAVAYARRHDEWRAGSPTAAAYNSAQAIHLRDPDGLAATLRL